MPFLTRNHGDVQQVCVAPRSGDAALRLRLTDESVAAPKSSDGGKSTPIADLTINEVLNLRLQFFLVCILHCICSLFSIPVLQVRRRCRQFGVGNFFKV
jgi:hypothetical protein